MRVVVVGAGIAGASAAFHLTQFGAEVYLVDANAPGRATLAGARERSGTAALQHSDTAVAGVRVAEEFIGADAVIVAAGAWSTELCKPLGLHFAVEPQRGQILHLKVAEANTEALPVIVPVLSDYYMLAFRDSRIVVGATRETGSGFDFRATAGGVAEVLQEGLRIAPGLRNATLEEIRVGFRPMSRDGLPLLGRPGSISGLVLATGLGRYGLALGPYIGLLAAQLAVGETPSSDSSYFVPDRKSVSASVPDRKSVSASVPG
jgi:D-amino-acid dehydrogenase